VNVFAILRDVGIAVAAVVTFVWLNPWNTVPTGTRGVVTQFGKIVQIEQEGLTLLPPWKKLAIFNIRAEEANIDKANGATSDTQPVFVDLTVRYSIFPDKVAEVYEKYSHSGDMTSYVQTATQEVFKAVTAKYSAPDLIAKRALVSQDIISALKVKVAQYGVQIINIDMRNFAFQESYMKAINSKVEQEQLRLAAENKFRTVEAEQKQKVAVAEAEASAVRARADGDAYAKVKTATAEADALKIQQAALAQSREVLELRRIEVERIKWSRWDGALPTHIFGGNGPIPFYNANEATK
jgi:regulator of protease activity HflC (stomatin/prohibitin superfamily)